ncbi:uncharacterized protein EI90DRAFT_1595140 [Cantharellus anzutake]|uniref:uncharacterized protein n=1 Tax=Cantharellus anzutake TaxID=1750568 RepID=UPI001902F4C6|nr:uncharacterized protein EI90DRAFT_1595140 [Cantharellus anzutake]KAF8328068.1 hypothetical protein EI90DRAFT_1595140 [Cantharellus anzutake]
MSDKELGSRSSTPGSQDPEDYLAESLSLLGVEAVPSDNSLSYGPLKLSVASKLGKANTLLADQFFSPSLVFGELIERKRIVLEGLTVLELGAGAALPSLLLSVIPAAPSLVTITDHPDPSIFMNLQNNVRRNANLRSGSCKVSCLPYIWGEDPEPLLKEARRLNPNQQGKGYDAMILSDLLYFDSSHRDLIESLTLLLRRHPSSVAYVGAGIYTSEATCSSFFSLAEEAGLAKEEGQVEPDWLGTMVIGRLSREDLAKHKANSRWWTLRWMS